VDRSTELSDELYARFRDLVLARCGLYYPERKRADLAHKLGMVLESSNCRTLAELYADAFAGGASWEAILAQLTIGETYFFRNEAQFDALRRHVLPELLARRAMVRTLRLWSAGCATGEEPYSLAIVLNELLPPDHSWNVSILATDINPHFLARAGEALYGNWSFRQTPNEVRDRYWSAEQGRWRLRPDIRRMVSFVRINLAEPSYPAITNGTSAMDIILCRNVTIYFDEVTIRQVVERFYNALTPGGWLIVGHAEPQASVYRQFEVHNFPSAVLYRKPLDAPLFSVVPAGRMFDPSAQSIPQPPTAPEPGSERKELHTPDRSRPDASQPAVSTMPPGPQQQSDDANRWNTILVQLARNEKFAAEELLIQLLRGDPTHLQARTMLGRLYADRADWPRARQQCEAALEQNPLYIPAHYLLAQICEHQGQLDTALAAYRRTVYLDHGFVPGMLGMANVWRGLGRPANAQRYYRNALKYLGEVPPTTTIPEADGASAGELVMFIARELEAITDLRD